MKKGIAIFFAAAYLLATTHLVEVLKLPLLIEHFIDHEDGFIEFMVHHYGGHEMDDDWDEDMKLPFMTDSTLLFIAFNLPGSKFAFKPHPEPSAPDKKLIWDDARFSSNHLSAIFQPPRGC